MQFTVPERKIIPINNDPFVFQVTPIGVMIHSKWGVEANVVTRRYGLRQQVLYLMYYGEE